ncbi:MAG: DeoR family transcriptional regulator [Minisyncoccia bacterium]
MNILKDTTNNLKNKGLSTINTESRTLANKAQKIVVAAYMVTGLLSETDEMQNLIRRSASRTLESLLAYAENSSNNLSLKNADHFLYEMISYVQVVYHTGSLSEMNYQVLTAEAQNLQTAIQQKIAKLENGTQPSSAEKISLEKLFSEMADYEKTENTMLMGASVKTDTTEKDKKADLPEAKTNGVVTKKHSTTVSASANTITKKPNAKQTNVSDKKPVKSASPVSAKFKRHEHILDILKQKKKASINDVCLLFKDCSSKTIQRDLNELIKAGKVMKRGDRRWATYDLK